MRAGLATAFLLTLLAGVGWYSLPEKEVLLPPELKTLNDRIIVDYGYNNDGTVGYSYLAETVPETLAEDEVPELRTETSYTRLLEVAGSGEDPLLTLETRFYSQPAYARDAGGTWKYLEYATTTEQAFRARGFTLSRFLTELLVRTAYADTASPFSGAGDGYILMNANCAGAVAFDPCPCDAWGDAHDAATGNTAVSNAVAASVFVVGEVYNDIFDIAQCNATFYRTFLPFDTSSIPSSATISAATLNIYVYAKNDGYPVDLPSYVTVTQSSQATHTTLATADYDQCGATVSPTEGVDSGQRKDIGAITLSTYTAFTLNATGIGWIAKSGQSSACSATTGISCFGLREGHDTENAIVTSPSIQSSISLSTSEESGTSQDPYLSVTYTANTLAVRGSGKLFPGGSFRIVNGKLNVK